MDQSPAKVNGLTIMDCDICTRAFNDRRKPLCPSCAQTTLYPARLLQVTSLLEGEKSHSQVEAIIRPGNDGVLATLPDDIDFDAITTGMKKYGLDQCKAERYIVEDRIVAVTQKAEHLRKQVEEYKAYMVDRRKELNQQREVLATGTTELEKLRPRMLEPVQIAMRKNLQRLSKAKERTIDSRALLCREAALACGLQRRRSSQGGSEYAIGGIVIPDLRELGMRSRSQTSNTTSSARTLAEPHALITASLDDIARLLSITSHYLSVRLPAEIVLPHGDFPRCVIMPEKSSYKHSEVPFPGQTSSQSNSPAASRVMDPALPRPRPLYLDYPLTHLSKEDPKSYGLFVEGVALLAWDLAWLCRTQGIDNVHTFEDFCMIGRNLWQLLVTQNRKPSRPSQDRRASEPPLTSNQNRDASSKHTGPTRFGLFSHASAGHSLAGADGLELLKDWKLASPARLTDKLKTFLLTEIQGAEWDLLEEQEWEQERDDEMPVLVGGSRRPQDSTHPAMSVMTVLSHDAAEDVKNVTADENRKKGSHGWMKIRGRTEEA